MNLVDKCSVTFLLSMVLACSGCTQDAKSVVVEACEFAFEPDTIKVEAGRTLELALINHGTLSHNITIMFENRDVATETIQSGSKMASVVSVTFDRPGRYKFYCAVPGHRNAGMEGTIVVNEAG